MSAVKEFLVPDLGEGLEDATISGWNVAVGDEVELNQTLCTVETNKAEVEIPSPYAGRIVELGGAEGETLTVGSVLVRIATSLAETEPVAPPQSANGAVRKPVLVGYGADDDMDASRRGSVGERPKAKPPVRKLAAELNVDLTRVTGSGPDGVITRDDVLAAAGRSAPTPDMVTVRGVQAEMAHRMTLSRRQIPDAHAGVLLDCSGLLRLRDRTRDITDDESPITPFVLTLRLLTIALRHHPNLNSTWLDTTDGPQIHLHSAVHLGFGVAAPRGLLVPVVSDAQDKTTRELAAVVARLIRDAPAPSHRRNFRAQRSRCPTSARSGWTKACR
jgi:pyruvate dehydrogenase E2 component (dihydrolipoamide acetyltransferase)